MCASRKLAGLIRSRFLDQVFSAKGWWVSGKVTPDKIWARMWSFLFQNLVSISELYEVAIELATPRILPQF